MSIIAITLPDGSTQRIVADAAFAENHYPGQWTAEPEAPAPVVVPAAVSMRQARLALDAIDKLDTVNTMIASMPGKAGKAARIEWEFSNEVRRTQPLVLQMGAALGMSATDLDQLFITAETL